MVNTSHGCRFTGPLEMTYRLDAERLSRSKLARVVFIRKNRRRNVEAAVMEDSLTMNEQSDPNSVCHIYVGHIAVRYVDYYA